MKTACHGICTNYCNVMTEIHIAKEAGYDGMEFLARKLMRYLENGGTTQALRQRVKNYGLETGIVNAFMNIELWRKDERAEMLHEAERYTRITAELDCPTLMIHPLFALNGVPYNQVMDIMTDNIGAIAEIGKRHGVRYQIELIAYTPFNTLEQGLKIINDVNAGNLGMVVDFWHLHAAGINTPADVAAMDPSLIYDIHFCDGRQPRLGEVWKEDILRNYLPGQSDIDVQAWTNAVLSTGYDGWWAPELASPLHWEDDLLDISRVCLDNMRSYIEKGKEMLA